MLFPKAMQWDCFATLSRGSSYFFILLYPSVSGLHQEMLKVLTLQQCASKLSVALSVPGVYSNLGLVPCIELPLPHQMGSDGCQMVSLCVNCLDSSCVLRCGRVNKKNLVVCLFCKPLEILHHFMLWVFFLSVSKVFEV